MARSTVEVIKNLQHPQLLKSSPRPPRSEKMCAAMDRGLAFHPNRGENVLILQGNKEAKFCPLVSGGTCFSQQQVNPGQSVNIKIDGSGHAEVGVTTQDPASLNVNVPQSPTALGNFIQLNEIRQHRHQCSIDLRRNARGDVIEVVYGGEKFRKKVDGAKLYWIVVYIRFGLVTVRLPASESHFQFSRHHGCNILLEEGNLVARSLHKNPFAVSFLNQRLEPGSSVVLECSPICDNGRPPSRYHVTIGLCPVDPSHIPERFPAMLRLTPAGVAFRSPIFILEVLEKGQCAGIQGQKGFVTVNIEEDNMVSYVTATGKVNRFRTPFDVSGGVWLSVELFRVSVTLPTGDVEATMPKVVYSGDSVENPAGTDAVDANLEKGPTKTVRVAPINRRRPSDYLDVIDVATGACPLADRVAKLEQKVEHLASCPCGAAAGMDQNACGNSSSSGDGLCNGNRKTHINDIGNRHGNGDARSAQEDCGGTETASSVSSPKTSNFMARGKSSVYVTEDVIRKSWTNLLSDLIVSSLSDHMFQEGYLSSDQLNKIQARERESTRSAAQMLLQIACQKHITIEAMRKLLDSSEQPHMKKYFPLT